MNPNERLLDALLRDQLFEVIHAIDRVLSAATTRERLRVIFGGPSQGQ